MRAASIFFVFKTALVLYCCCVTISVSGSELESFKQDQYEDILVTELESSKEDHDENIQVRFGRFLVWTTTTTSTSFTLIYTQLLTTYR